MKCNLLKYLFVISTFIVLETNAQTAWIFQSSGTTNDLNSVSFAEADSGMAVGSQGIILRTTNGGITWDSLSSGISCNFEDVCFIDGRTGTVVGEGGVILRTTDGGITWQTQSSGTTNKLSGVMFIDTNNGFAVGEGGIILSTNDGGTTWLQQSSSTTQNLNSVYFINVDSVMVVGSLGTILQTTNRGQTWNSQISGTTLNLMDVHFTNSVNGTIVGGDYDSVHTSTSGIILFTDDGGDVWEILPENMNYFLEAICFSDADNGIAVGWQGSYGPVSKIIGTCNGGYTWNEQNLYASTYDSMRGLYSVSFTSTNIGNAVGANGIIVRTETGGWTGIKDGSQNYNNKLEKFKLKQNFPNPFNPFTIIEFSIPRTGFVTLKIYNLLGQEVATLVSDKLTLGGYQYNWDASQHASGMYFYKLETESFNITKKMILLR